MHKTKKTCFLFIMIILILFIGTTAISATDNTTISSTDKSITSHNDLKSIEHQDDIINEKTTHHSKNIKTDEKNKKIVKQNNLTKTPKTSTENYIYVSSNANSQNTGSDKTTPTTLSNALNKIQNNTIIYLTTNKDEDTYKFNTTYTISQTQENITFKIQAEEGKTITFDAQNMTSFFNIKQGYNITISNIVFKNANANYAIRAINSTVNINNSTFQNNTMQSSLGLLNLRYSNITINNTIFKDNTLNNLSSLITSSGNNSFILNNSEFENNIGYLQSQLIYSMNTNLTMENNTFKNNKLDVFGLIYAESNIHNTIISNKFYNNSMNEDGGCIYIYNSTAIFKNNEFIKNTAKNGGALFLEKTDSNITNTSFINNTATFSGGAIMQLSVNTLIINNSQFISNKAAYDGGALHSIQSDVNIYNSNFYNNTASNGGALYIVYNNRFGFSRVYSSVFEDNYALNGCALYSTNNINLLHNVLINEKPSNIIYCKDKENYYINDNWWGSNNPEFKSLTNNLLPTTWISITTENETLTNGTNKITLSLIKDNPKETMPQLNVTFTTKTGKFAQNSMQINDTIINYYDGNLNDCIITINNQKINLTKKCEPFIYSDDITCNPGDLININIKLNNDTTANTVIKFDNNTIYNDKIKDGILNYTYAIDPKYAQSIHLLTITYMGDNKYQQKTITQQIIIRVDENSQTTYIKPIENKTEIQSNQTLPDKYDLRNLSQVTDAKDQAYSGSCWSFAALGALESAILKKYNITYDFSENNMKNLLKRYSLIGEITGEPNGGNRVLEPVSYLVGWYGPINETMDPYYDLSVISPQLNSTYHVQDICFIDPRGNYTDNNGIKEAIMKYGAVVTSAYIKGTSLNQYNTLSSANHAILIVGWDDNYSRFNFHSTDIYGNDVYPAGDGAFIIKNSWGKDVGDDGFQYVSYYDKCIGEVDYSWDTTGSLWDYAIMLNNTENYDNIYQYDTVVEPYYQYNPKTSYKNNYVAKNNESISAIGMYFLQNTNYTIEVYVNNVLKMIQDGNIDIPGYRTIKLNNYIPLTKDDSFTVVLNTVRGGSKYRYTLIQSTNYKALNHENESFIKYGDDDWQDLYYKGSAAALKVYTKTTPTLNTNINTTNQQLNIETNITTDKPGILTFKINNITLKDENSNILKYNISTNKTIKFTYNISHIPEKQLNFTTEFITDDYNITQQKNMSIPNPLKILANDTTTKVQSPTNITIKVTNSNQNIVDNGVIEIYLNNTLLKTVNVKNGIASTTLTFNTSGNYKLTLRYVGVVQYDTVEDVINVYVNRLNTKITLNVEDTRYNRNNIINGILVDENNNPISNKNITLTLTTSDNNKKTINITTDNNGKYSYNNKQNNILGKVDVKVEFSQDNVYETSENKTQYNIEESNITITYNQTNNQINNTTLKITLNGDTIENTKISIYLNNTKIQTENIKTGENNYKLNLSMPGEYKLTILYDGELIRNDTININIRKYTTQLQLNATNITENQKTTIQGILLDEFKKPLNTIIKLEINNQKLYLSTDNEGKFKFTYKIETPGTYQIKAIYETTPYYQISTNTTIINVSTLKEDVIITTNFTKAYIGDQIQLTAIITDKNKNPITGGKVAFKINGVTLKDENGNVLYGQLKDGKAYITYQVPKTWKNGYLTITYGGTGKYNSARMNTSNIQILNPSTTIKINTLPQIKNGQTITITATIADNTVNTGRAVFKINGVTLKDKNGNPIYVQPKNGVLSINYTIPENFSAKNYTITVVFSNDLYSRLETKTTLPIIKTNTKIQMSNFRASKQLVLKAVVLTEFNKNVVGETKVTIKFNGVTVVNRYIITNGIVEIKIDITKYSPKIYEILLISGEDNRYTMSNKKVTLTVY